MFIKISIQSTLQSKHDEAPQNKNKQSKTNFQECITYKSIKRNKNTSYKNPNQGKTMKTHLAYGTQLG